MRYVLFGVLFFLGLNFLPSSYLSAADEEGRREAYQSDAIIFEQVEIENAGYRLAEEGAYDAAIAKYREALTPRFIVRERDKCHPLGGIMNVHRLQGKFDEALQESQWFLKINPKKEEYKDNQLELGALAGAQNTKSNQPVYEYIKYLRDKYKRLLPPIGYDGNYEPIVTSKIIFCYSWIGDADGGIAYMDEILKYWEKKSGQDLHRPGNKNQYFLIRQAFEQDKKEGFKGCLDAKPGEVCMGRATKALIQSDYFPW